MQTRSILKFLLVACFAAAIVLMPGSIDRAVAQFSNRSIDTQQIYTQIPNLPLENQYISRETGEIAEDSTLVNRMIQYHLYTASRIPNSRLDWKLTIADYLGVNEWMQAGLYPGADSLRQNPIEGDKAAIAQLNRAQRDALIDAIISLFVTPAAPSSDSAVPRQVPAEPIAAQQLPL
ncbi:MAG: hypothetical protein F6K28_31330 [Microcoleus sp. SIO2G3]|nr:hypothetical protein [Microcoleus sp. SIO2G3]